MEQKEIKIEIPEGYEIDKKKSSFEKIVFRKKSSFNAYDGRYPISGYYIDDHSNIRENPISSTNCSYNKNIFTTEKLAKKALAMAQLSQIIEFNQVLRRYQAIDVEIKNPPSMYQAIYYTKEKSFSIEEFEVCRDTIFVDFCLVTFKIPSDILLKNKLKEEILNFIDENEQLLKDYFMID